MLKDAKNYLKGYKQTSESCFFRNMQERGRVNVSYWIPADSNY